MMRTVLVLGLLAILTGCRDGQGRAEPDEGARVVVTTSILGDVVRNLVGDAVEVEVVMPPNVDPHDFAPSAQQASAIREADALVVNGLGFEEGLGDTIEAAADDGVLVITAADAIDALPFDAGADEHEGEGDDDEHALDPHLFTDPARMREAAEAIAEELADHVPALDTPEVAARTRAYLGELEALDAEVEDLLAPIPTERRVLVTNHEVFGYFGDRYGFEILGTVIPGGSTLAEPSAADLADLADEIEEHDVPAIFIDTSSPARLAEALAAEGADVDVVELYSESLGDVGSPAATYVGMVRTNAQRIASALL